MLASRDGEKLRAPCRAVPTRAGPERVRVVCARSSRVCVFGVMEISNAVLRDRKTFARGYVMENRIGRNVDTKEQVPVLHKEVEGTAGLGRGSRQWAHGGGEAPPGKDYLPREQECEAGGVSRPGLRRSWVVPPVWVESLR